MLKSTNQPVFYISEFDETYLTTNVPGIGVALTHRFSELRT